MYSPYAANLIMELASCVCVTVKVEDLDTVHTTKICCVNPTYASEKIGCINIIKKNLKP